MSIYYILEGKTPVLADLITWAKWFETSGDIRIVAKTEVGSTTVSTVFLGLDHSFGVRPPMLFETMIFRNGAGDDQWRCSTWDQAEDQHAEAVEIVRKDIS